MRGRRERGRNARNLGFTESARYREPVLETGVAFARVGVDPTEASGGRLARVGVIDRSSLGSPESVVAVRRVGEAKGLETLGG
jgi:hypothetical protein